MALITSFSSWRLLYLRSALRQYAPVLVVCFFCNPHLASADAGIELINAADRGDASKVSSLIADGADVNSKWERTGVTPLIASAQKGHTKVVRELLKAHAIVDSRGNDGATAMLQAAQAGHPDVVKLLIDAEANVDVQRGDGATALIGAAENGHLDVVRILLDHQAAVDAKTRNGVTALLAASLPGHTEIVQALLKSNAEVDARDNVYGATALMMAAQQGHVGVVKALLGAHANVGIRMKNGQSALDLASSRRQTAVIDLLHQAGAK